MVSTNTICFEAINRVYRNTVVQHIRETIRTNHPGDWLETLKLPLQKEWETLQHNAELRRTTGEYGSQLTDEFDYLGVNNFYVLFQKYFAELFPSSRELTSEETQQTKQNLLIGAREIKNMRDPALGHPGDIDISDADALQMLDYARRILDFIDEGASEELRRSWELIRFGGSPDTGSTDEDRNPIESSTLPARETITPRFVGRQTELESLLNWLNDPHSRVWLLAGDGGKGKTAIAYEFAVSTSVQPLKGFEAVIWLSAKARKFLEGQTISMDSPDFWDLDSALTCVLRAYGAIDIETMNTDTKAKECISYLQELPALIVLDDVDSLEGDGLMAMNFFTFGIQSTKSKFLITSRRVPFGMEPLVTQVTGFRTGSDDGNKFIDSRIQLYDLDPNQFSRSVNNNILDSCDGSPLFMEELLRLCRLGETPDNAMRLWKSQQGEQARSYALRREFDMLSDAAKKVLLACALFRGPISLPSIQVAAEVQRDQAYSAIQELQNLFLLPKPRVTQDEPTFGLNINTRSLVIEVYGGTDLAHRINGTIQVIMGETEATPAHRGRIGQLIRQAVSLVKLNRHPDAESTLLEAIELFPENADLHGNLGWVYKSWRPTARYTDARDCFTRAADLKSSRRDMYWHWAGMEQSRSEWTAAAQAAERGLEILPDSEDLEYKAGLARSQLAKDLYRQAQYGRAEQEARKAETHLKAALLDLDDVGARRYQFHSDVHRAIVINCEHLVRVRRSQSDDGGTAQYIRLLGNALQRWKNEHPGDPNASSEEQRLVYWFPALQAM